MCRLGYLAQQVDLEPGAGGLAGGPGRQPALVEVKAELERVEASLGEPEVYSNPKALERALDAQQALLKEYDALGGDSYAGRVRELLLGLGLTEADFAKPLGVLSGGQKKLVGLARLLLLQPSVLLLDEPDNHLDLPGKLYLERLIQGYPGAVVIVSHDRYLLDAVVTHITEMEDGRLTTFSRRLFQLHPRQRRCAWRASKRCSRCSSVRLRAWKPCVKRYAIWGQVYDNEKFAQRLQDDREAHPAH